MPSHEAAHARQQAPLEAHEYLADALQNVLAVALQNSRTTEEA